MESKKVVVITGGAGFIGSHLVDRFLARGFRVIALDNFISGRKENLLEAFKNPDFTFIEHDVTKHIDLPCRADYILHFASPASPVDYSNHPIKTLKVGALGTHNVLGVTRAMNCRMLLASTSEVYGDPLVHPQTEDYWGNVNPIGPRSVYDEAKRFAEAITMAYHRKHGLNTGIVRIFNTYGPRMRADDGRAVPTFIKQALSGEDITVYGDGSQTRSFCYIDDLVNGIEKLLLSDFHEPVNLGNPTEMTIKEMAELIVRLTGSSSKIVYRPLPADDPKVRRPDISRAEKILAWKPVVPVEQGIETTIGFFRSEGPAV